ncbi:MAG: hypothetical protein AAB500_00505 [Patescibacteria group bacterium]
MRRLAFLIPVLLFAFSTLAFDMTSTSFIVRDPIIGTFGEEWSTSTNYGLISAGHTTLSDIGGTSTNFQIRYGFLYWEESASLITFDIDTTAADTCGVTESAAPYTVSLGTITTTDTRVSGATDSVNHICVDLETRAAGGAVVTVANANGANGLASASVPADDIDSADSAVADGTEMYGLCIVSTSATTGTLDDEGEYNADTCAANSETNDTGSLSTSPENIFDTNGLPVIGGRGQISVNVSISSTTPAHNDYADAITFIATGTF